MRLERIQPPGRVSSIDLHVTRKRAREIVTQLEDAESATDDDEIKVDLISENARVTLSTDEAHELRESFRALLDDPRPERHEHVSAKPDYDQEITLWLKL